MASLFYTTYICVDLAHHEIFGAKVGKGGIRTDNFCMQHSSYLFESTIFLFSHTGIFHLEFIKIVLYIREISQFIVQFTLGLL